MGVTVMVVLSECHRRKLSTVQEMKTIVLSILEVTVMVVLSECRRRKLKTVKEMKRIVLSIVEVTVMVVLSECHRRKLSTVKEMKLIGECRRRMLQTPPACLSCSTSYEPPGAS